MSDVNGMGMVKHYPRTINPSYANNAGHDHENNLPEFVLGAHSRHVNGWLRLGEN